MPQRARSLIAFAPMTCTHGFSWRGALLVTAAIALAGCATVKPSQREALSKPEMTPASDGLEDEFYGHIESARQGSFGGHGVGAGGGGGCGCG